jgi:hypothetical protein
MLSPDVDEFALVGDCLPFGISQRDIKVIEIIGQVA